MSRVEFIWISAELNDALNEIRDFPELTSEQEIIEGDFRFSFEGVRPEMGRITIGIEADVSDDYPTVIDVDQARWMDAPEKVQAFFDLLARRTKWEIASRFDNDDHPLVYRPPLK